MNFFYVIMTCKHDEFDEETFVYPCKNMREAKDVAITKRAFFPAAEIVICKAIYSELKVKVNV